VLQCIQRVVGEPGNVLAGCVDSYDTARVSSFS